MKRNDIAWYHHHPPARCFASTNTTPLARPMLIDPRLAIEYVDSYNSSPMKLIGILFNDPTKLNVVVK